jgi:putative ABC transport system permease protein
MALWLIIFRNLRQHALSTIVTAVSIALAGGLLMSIWVVKHQTETAFTGMTGGFDGVLGARGSKIQLVLNAIFHLEESPGNIRWGDYQDIKRNPAVALAVPIAMGDNYRGFRLIGTTMEMFTDAEYAPGKRYTPRPPGRLFDPERREALVGSFASQRLGLKLGDVFNPYHGLIFDEKTRHSERYVVVGVLEPTNTPADRVIWIPLEGIQKMEGHDPKAATDVSAVLVKLRGSSGGAGFMIDSMYNKQGDRLTFAWPVGQLMAYLLSRVSWFDRVLTLVAYLVALVATGSVLASIYNSMNERRRGIAILRALGARRRTIFSTIVLEAAAISALGMTVAFAVYGGIMAVVTSVVRAQTGVVLHPLAWNEVMLWAPAAMIAVSALAGVVPAIKAYRTDVASHLTATT